MSGRYHRLRRLTGVVAATAVGTLALSAAPAHADSGWFSQSFVSGTIVSDAIQQQLAREAAAQHQRFVNCVMRYTRGNPHWYNDHYPQWYRSVYLYCDQQSRR